jgi:hypothetical protein
MTTDFNCDGCCRISVEHTCVPALEGERNDATGRYITTRERQEQLAAEVAALRSQLDEARKALGLAHEFVRGHAEGWKTRPLDDLEINALLDTLAALDGHHGEPK